eukprot:gi/632987762/ref/XP_007882735.1/ PREDICTED: uncharacterized protein LOC103171757 [Callorhinchus milii]
MFVRGDSAQISCSGNYPGSIYSLYIDGKFFTSLTAPENIQTANFALSDFSAGNYTCKYATHIDGRKFTSPESERVGIYLWDPLKKPTISLKPDSQVIVRGESAVISCSGKYPGSNFSLYRDGEFISSQPAPENKQSTTFTQSDISAGDYWCKYTAHLEGREITSPESDRLTISVRGYLTTQGIANVGRLILVISLCPLIIVLLVVHHRRIKTYNSQERVSEDTT